MSQPIASLPAEHLAVVSEDSTAQSMLIEALSGLMEPKSGNIEIGEMDAVEAASAGLGRLVALAHKVEIFHASVVENVELGRSGIGQDQVRTALRAVGLSDTIRNLPKGMDTSLETDGYPFTRDQQVRLMLARAIVANPKLLLVGRLFDELPPDERLAVWKSIRKLVQPCTMILTTRDRNLASECDRSVTLANQSELTQ